MLEPPDILASQLAPPLDYAPARRARRRRIARAAIFVLLLFFGTHLARVWIPSAVRQLQTLYWQRRCLSYTAPPTQVVYEQDPATAAKLLAGDHQYTRH